jgi:hypothetical protein
MRGSLLWSNSRFTRRGMMLPSKLNLLAKGPLQFLVRRASLSL